MKEETKIAGIVVGAVLCLFTAHNYGYGQGQDSNNGAIQYLEARLSDLSSQNERLSIENESLRARNLVSSGSAVEIVSPISKSNFDEPGISSELESQTIKVSRQQTASFFNGELEITTVATDFSGSPLRNRVTLSLLIPGSEPQQFEQVDSGFSTTLENYQILVTETDTFYATYRVYKLD